MNGTLILMADWDRRRQWNSTLPARDKFMGRGAPLLRSRSGSPRLRVIDGARSNVVDLAGWQDPEPAKPTAETRLLVLERDGYCCVCCGRPVHGQRYSLGHRLRASQGGRAVPSNPLTFLGWGGELCHGRIDRRDNPDDELRGLTVRSYDDPATVPVQVMTADGLVLYWLTDDGRYADYPPGGDAA